MYRIYTTAVKQLFIVKIRRHILKGIKQGDPFSPIIFNLILDPVIGILDETTEGVRMRIKNISVLAFADDLVLLDKDGDIAEKQNSILSNYLKKLSISASKCSTFKIRCRDKT